MRRIERIPSRGNRMSPGAEPRQSSLGYVEAMPSTPRSNRNDTPRPNSRKTEGFSRVSALKSAGRGHHGCASAHILWHRLGRVKRCHTSRILIQVPLRFQARNLSHYKCVWSRKGSITINRSG